VAANSKWAPNSLTAPAAKIWHVKIDNQDNKNNQFTGFGHNFTVASGPSFPERIFQTPKFGYGSQVFDVPALPAGSYLFICTLHQNVMTGTLTIK
jgi:plastocyanin